MKYRKKPIEIDAVQWFSFGDHDAVLNYHEAYDEGYRMYSDPTDAGLATHLNSYKGNGLIKTLEGWYEVCPGDFIITGVKGECYPCKEDIFNITYEKVKELRYRYKAAYGGRGSGKSWALLPAPPHPKIRLTDEEILKVAAKAPPVHPWMIQGDMTLGDIRKMAIDFARAIEDKILEKNT